MLSKPGSEDHFRWYGKLSHLHSATQCNEHESQAGGDTGGHPTAYRFRGEQTGSSRRVLLAGERLRMSEVKTGFMAGLDVGVINP